MGTYKFQMNERTTVKGNFHIYQARNGSIQLMMGVDAVVLSREQVENLRLNIYELEDFDYDNYKKYYEIVDY